MWKAGRTLPTTRQVSCTEAHPGYGEMLASGAMGLEQSGPMTTPSSHKSGIGLMAPALIWKAAGIL